MSLGINIIIKLKKNRIDKRFKDHRCVKRLFIMDYVYFGNGNL